MTVTVSALLLSMDATAYERLAEPVRRRLELEPRTALSAKEDEELGAELTRAGARIFSAPAVTRFRDSGRTC